jgi:5,10-methylenetetrahydrofolate reductase
MTTLYKYLGGGSLVHVPARDITEADVEERAELWLENGIDEALLLKSGLYQKLSNEPAPKKSKAQKEGE